MNYIQFLFSKKIIFQLLAKSLAPMATTPKKPAKRLFVPLQPADSGTGDRANNIPVLRDELVLTNNSLAITEEDLQLEADRLAQEIAHLQDALDMLNRMQRK